MVQEWQYRSQTGLNRLYEIDLFAHETAGTRTQDLRIKSPLLYRLSYDLAKYKTSVHSTGT